MGKQGGKIKINFLLQLDSSTVRLGIFSFKAFWAHKAVQL